MAACVKEATSGNPRNAEHTTETIESTKTINMHIHILGICGTFMGGLAALAIESGHTVTGCDANVYPPMSDQLQTLGIALTHGFGDHVLMDVDFRPDVFVVGNVVSRARLADGTPKFPLMEAILDKGLPYISGPQWLQENILQGKHVLAVAGTHGKTTTSAMLAWVLQQTNQAPGFLIGGIPLNFTTSAKMGDGRYFVIEADEYDTAFFDKRSKFVHYRPRTAVLNNLEYDHADIFDDIAAIERQFHHLVRSVPSSGQIVVNQASGEVNSTTTTEPKNNSLQRVLDMGCWSQTTAFGGINSDWQAAGTPHDFQVMHLGQTVGHVKWTLQGIHNQSNALAAIAAAHHVGVNPEQACDALCVFANVKRRMEWRGTVAGVAVFDDFAHHPSAIATTLDGVKRGLLPSQRIVAVLEPRSNTMKQGAMKALLPASLQCADLVFCNSASLDWDVESVFQSKMNVHIAKGVDALLLSMLPLLKTGDVVVCMSNGSFDGIHAKLLDKLTKTLL